MFTHMNAKSFLQQRQWQHPERKPLLTWDIKARNYNTIIMECFFAFTMLIAFTGSAFMYWVFLDINNENKAWFTWPAITMGMVMFLFFFSTFYPWTHPRKIFVYRLTAEGFEVQGWNDIEKWKTVVIGIGIALVIAILGLVSVFPEAIFGLFIGPPLMGLLYYRLFMSEDYWDMQKDFIKGKWDWSKFTDIHVYRKRAIIILFFNWDRTKDEGIGRVIKMDVYLFCPPERLDEIIDFIKAHTQNLPYQEGYYSILQ